MFKKIFFTLLILSAWLSASELELGFGVGGMFYPDYLGSKNDNTLLIPYPYINYTSDTLNIDKDGLNKKLFNYKNVHLELSVSGSLPVKSSGAREGMDNLDPALELGPALVYTVYQDKNFDIQLDLPLRAVVSTNFKEVNYRGYLSELRAEFEYDYHGYFFQLHTGGVWGDAQYHNYLYGVGATDVRPNRPRYEAKAGYSGYKTSMGVSKKFKNFWAGTFVRHYNLNHTIYANSPLKEKSSALYGGIFIAYIFDEKLTRSLKNWLE